MKFHALLIEVIRPRAATKDIATPNRRKARNPLGTSMERTIRFTMWSTRRVNEAAAHPGVDIGSSKPGPSEAREGSGGPCAPKAHPRQKEGEPEEEIGRVRSDQFFPMPSP